MTLSDIDDLQAVASRNRRVRQAEARRAEGIIEEEIQQFAAWLGSLEVLPTLAALRTRAAEIAEQVVAENAGKWETASPRDLERVDAMARAIVNRLLHEPTLQMKEMRDDRVHARMALVRELFGLSVEEGALGAAAPSRLDAEPRSSSPRCASFRRPGAAAGAADADRDARQRAGAGPGRVGRRAAARAGRETEIVTITTLGDRGAAVEDKSRWVSELERALLDGRIDVAVHSAKDVPTELAEGLELVAVPERADPRDAICGAAGLAELPAGARIGTSSVRRAAQILALRDDVEVVELRGNVDTRLRKLADGQVDALVLALAGLQRLGRDDEAGGVLRGAGGPRRRPGRAGARGAPRRARRRRAGARVSDAAAMACVGRRAGARARARCLLQHAGGRPRAAARLRRASS